MPNVDSRPPADSVVEMTELVLPQHTNSMGTVFGGTVLSWVDIAAAVCAMRHCRKQVVTASIDAMHFLAPIHLGWFVTIRASVNFTSRTSCEVGVKVISENPLTGERFHTASAYATMVALDHNNKPSSMPQITPETEAEKTRHEDAKLRRKARLKVKEEAKARRQKKG